jgi:hypothetical protein
MNRFLFTDNDKRIERERDTQPSFIMEKKHLKAMQDVISHLLDWQKLKGWPHGALVRT